MDKNSIRLVTTTMILQLLTIFLSTSFVYTGKPIEQHYEMTSESQSIPPLEDPTPGYWETSEYLIGSVAIGVVFPESNGVIDPQTENWTSQEKNEVLSEIQNATYWWSIQNPNASANLIIVSNETVPIDREPINYPENQYPLWTNDTLFALGYHNIELSRQAHDYANALRDEFETDWAMIIFVVDSSNDPDGMFEGGGYARGDSGGPFLFMTYDNAGWGISEMDRICSHELAHMFWATDEYIPADNKGYLNVTSIPFSGCLMHNATWCLSGAPHGYNGTWGQVGWRDSDDDGIQDIVDTFPRTYLNPSERIGNVINYTGVATVTTTPNKNPDTNWYWRNVTINKIQSIKFNVNDGNWTDAIITYSNKDAIVNFTFITEPLPPGEYNITVRATNQWGNAGYASETVVIPYEVHDMAITNVTTSKTIVCQGYTMSINVTIENKGNVSDSFDVTVYANTTHVQTQKIFLENGTIASQTFIWNTSGFERYKNYTISAIATLPGDVNETDNTLIGDSVTVVIPGDIDADEDVDIFDIVKIASAYGSEQGEPEYFDNGDINNDRNIDIFDIVAAAGHYGEIW